MLSLETVKYEIADRVATIKLNRPEVRNAFNQQLRLDLSAALDAAIADDEVRCIVLTGAGPGFGAGHDLRSGLCGFENIADLIAAEYKPFLMAIDNCPKLVIAAVNGVAAGISGALALACDYVLMSESASIYLAFAPIGLVPDGGFSHHLVRKLGYSRALEVVVEGQRLSADQCFESGLVNRVLPANDLLAESQALACRLAKGAPLAQMYAKSLLKVALNSPLSDVIDAEAEAQSVCMSSQDSLNAIDAFFKKRETVFTGK